MATKTKKQQREVEIPEILYRDMDYFFRKKHFFGAQKKSDHNVSALFRERNSFNHAVADLQENGFRNDEIYTAVSHEGSVLDVPMRIVSVAPFFVPAGIVVGLVLGAMLGWLMHLGYFQFMSIEPFVSASPWQALAATSTVGGFVVGILALVFGMRWPENQPWKFESQLPEGTLFLMVRTLSDQEAEKARMILRANVRGTSFPSVTEKLAA